jgi:hypothetical protein
LTVAPPCPLPDGSATAVNESGGHDGRFIRPRRRLIKGVSEFVGHKTPEYQLGAARITQVYTHMLPGELERARVLFDKFLVERAEDDPAPTLTLAGR